MPDIFRVQGSVTNAHGDHLENLLVAIVDEDTFSDDLLGIGLTDARGGFRLSFTREEFNQDPFERDEIPTLRVIFSVPHKGSHKVIHQKSFPELTFQTLEEDLGEIRIDAWEDKTPEFLEKLDPIPGYYKKVTRLNISDELVQHALEEVAPLVESLTGWPNLLRDIHVDITDDFSPYLAGYLQSSQDETNNEPPDPILTKLLSHWINALALYDPATRTIVVGRSALGKHNLDAMKVALGHELVHVGQHRYHPHAFEQQLEHLSWLQTFLDNQEELTVDRLREILTTSHLNEQMTEIEGYAYYIQTDFLEKHYNMATFFGTRSLLHTTINFLLSKFAPDVNNLQQIKANQYTDGRQDFRDQEKQGLPAAFCAREQEARTKAQELARTAAQAHADKDLPTAKTLYEALVTFYQTHPAPPQHALQASACLADVLYAMNDLQNAEPIFQKVFEEQKQLLGDDHIDTQITRARFGSLLNRLEKHREALPHLEASYALLQELFGPDAPETQYTQQHLAATRLALGNAKTSAH